MITLNLGLLKLSLDHLISKVKPFIAAGIYDSQGLSVIATDNLKNGEIYCYTTQIDDLVLGAITALILNPNSRKVKRIKVGNTKKLNLPESLNNPDEHILVKQILQTDKYLTILSLSGGSFSKNDFTELKHVIRVLFNSLGHNPKF